MKVLFNTSKKNVSKKLSWISAVELPRHKTERDVTTLYGLVHVVNDGIFAVHVRFVKIIQMYMYRCTI